MCEAWAAMTKYKGAGFSSHPAAIFLSPFFLNSQNLSFS